LSVSLGLALDIQKLIRRTFRTRNALSLETEDTGECLPLGITASVLSHGLCKYVEGLAPGGCNLFVEILPRQLLQTVKKCRSHVTVMPGFDAIALFVAGSERPGARYDGFAAAFRHGESAFAAFGDGARGEVRTPGRPGVNRMLYR
jgi:hypothetical protein